MEILVSCPAADIKKQRYSKVVPMIISVVAVLAIMISVRSMATEPKLSFKEEPVILADKKAPMIVANEQVSSLVGANTYLWASGWAPSSFYQSLLGHKSQHMFCEMPKTSHELQWEK